VFTDEARARMPKFVEGEVLVKFRSDMDMSTESINRLNNRFKVLSTEPVDRTRRRNVVKISFPSGIDARDVAEAYRNDPDVEYADLNYIRELYSTPDDPRFVNGTQWGPQKIKLLDVSNPGSGWNWTTGTREVLICILDTGADYNHQDLHDNIWVNPGEDYNSNGTFEFASFEAGGDLDGIDNDMNGFVDDIIGWDFVSVTSGVHATEDPGPRDNDPSDVHGHGTHCSGIASAVTNNGIGIAGVGWNCRIMPVRAGYLASNGGGYLEDSDWIAGIYYAADNGAAVISMSFGGGGASSVAEDAINYAHGLGVVLVAAAGNNRSSTPHYPAGYDNVIAVAATDSADRRASFTNYGSWVAVAAPGVSINSCTPGNTYASWNGTSMACPHVAGLVGLLKTTSPFASADELTNTITRSADNIDAQNPGYEGLLGSGRINAYETLAPQVGALSISVIDTDSGRDDFTNSRSVTIQANSVVGTPDQMMISEDPAFSGASWVTFVNPATFELSPGDGTKEVYYRLKQLTEFSPTMEGSTILDTVTPEVASFSLKDITTGDEDHTNERAVSVESSYNPDFVEDMMISENNDFSGAGWEPYSGKFELDLSSAGEGTKEVYFRIRDAAGNISETASREIIYDPTILGITGIELRDRTSGSLIYTNERTIEVFAVNVISTPESMRISEEATFSGAAWIPFSDPATFEIYTASDGAKAVYYQLRESGGETSEVVSDSITLDTLNPGVSTAEPHSGDNNVETTSNVRITFDDEMITGSVSVVIHPALTLGTPSWTGGNTVLTFNPPGTMGYSTVYILTVEGDAKDKAENELGEYTWSFMTGEQSTIEGYVKTGSTPLAGVSVEVMASDGTFMGAPATDITGYFMINQLRDGTYCVDPLTSGYEISTESVALQASDTASLNFDLSPAWPQYHCDRMRSGLTLSSSIEPTLKFAWSYKFNEDNLIFPGSACSPVAAYGNVYIGSFDFNMLCCLDAQTGALKWSRSGVGSETTFPTVANGKVYSFGVNTTYATNAFTGAPVWSRTTSGRLYHGHGPAFAGGRLYVIGDGVMNAALYCLNADTGALIWTKGIAHAKGSATVKDGVVYLTNDSNKRLMAIDARTYATIWTFNNPLASNYWITTPAVDNASTYHTGWCGHIYCVSRETGSLNWSEHVGDSMYDTPALCGEKVVFGRTSVYARNRLNGAPLWTTSMPYGMNSLGSKAAANGFAYMGASNYLFAADLSNGDMKWSYENEGYIYDVYVYEAAPAIYQNMLYTATRKGMLMAFKINEQPALPQELKQFQYFSGSEIPAGGDAEVGRVTVRIKMSDPDNYGALYPELEIRPTSESFSGTADFTGVGIPHGTGEVSGLVTAEGLVNLTDYHWRVRVRDEYDKVSGWVQFNGGNKAFRVFDVATPEILSTDPSSGEADVTTFRDITITFSEPMNRQGVHDAFHVLPATPGSFESWLDEGRTAVFNPSGRLLGRTVYTVSLEGSASDEAGNILGQDFTFTFETASAGEISGYVTIKGYGGVMGAEVEISQGGLAMAKGASNYLGYYNIENLTEGTYTVQARLPSHSLGTALGVNVLAGENTAVNLELTPGWPMYLQNREHSRTDPGPGMSPPLKLKWSYFVGESSPGVPHYVDNAAAIDDGVVFIGCDSGILHAIDLEDGSSVWSHDTNASWMWNSPSVTGGTVIVEGNSRLRALNSQTGALLWSNYAGDVSYGSIVDNGRIYLGADRNLKCFDLEDGTFLWSHPLPGNSYPTPCIYEGTAFAVGGSVLQAVDLETRNVRWFKDIGGGLYQESCPVIYDGKLYIGSSGGDIFAFNAADGTVLWTYSQFGTIYNSPLVEENTLYFGGAATMFALDRHSGTFLWSTPVGQHIQSSPIMINDTIYVGGEYGSGNNSVFGINAASGEIVWSYATGNGIWAPPAAAEGTLVIGCEDGYVRAFEPGTPEETSYPVITEGPTAECITTSEAVIKWTTDEPANSMVEYGRTISYNKSMSTATLTTGHAMTLEGLSDNVVYHFRSGSRDGAGNGPTWSGDLTFTTSTIPGKDYTFPAITVLVDGARVMNGDVISSSPDIIATVTDNTTVDVNSIHLIVDGVTAEGVNIAYIDEPRSCRLTYSVPHELAPESVMKHTIFLSASDQIGNESVWEAANLRVIPGKVKMLGQPLPYPSVFKPAAGNTLMITYNLSSNADITLFVYDIGGRLVLTRKFGAGTQGGRAGYNSFGWNGISDAGGIIGNGIYVYKITSGKEIIGTGKIVVYD